MADIEPTTTGDRVEFWRPGPVYNTVHSSQGDMAVFVLCRRPLTCASGASSTSPTCVKTECPSDRRYRTLYIALEDGRLDLLVTLCEINEKDFASRAD